MRSKMLLSIPKQAKNVFNENLHSGFGHENMISSKQLLILSSEHSFVSDEIHIGGQNE